MILIWQVSLLIVSIAFLILVAFLLPTIMQVRKTAQQVEIISADLHQNLPETLANLNEITGNLSQMVSYGKRRMEVLGEAVDDVRSMVDDIVHFERELKTRIENPIMETLSTLTALVKAIRSFAEALRGRG